MDTYSNAPDSSGCHPRYLYINSREHCYFSAVGTIQHVLRISDLQPAVDPWNEESIIGSAGRNGRTGMARELQIHLDPAVLKTSSPMSGTNVLFIIELLRTPGLRPP